MSLEYHINVTIFFLLKFAALVSFKVSSGFQRKKKEGPRKKKKKLIWKEVATGEKGVSRKWERKKKSFFFPFPLSKKRTFSTLHFQRRKTWIATWFFFLLLLLLFFFQVRKLVGGNWPSRPPTGGMQNGSSAGTCTRCINTFSHVWAPTCMPSRWLGNKISALELRRKFIKSDCVAVGRVCVEAFLFSTKKEGKKGN